MPYVIACGFVVVFALCLRYFKAARLSGEVLAAARGSLRVLNDKAAPEKVKQAEAQRASLLMLRYGAGLVLRIGVSLAIPTAALLLLVHVTPVADPRTVTAVLMSPYLIGLGVVATAYELVRSR